jgi:hypothetical protein
MNPPPPAAAAFFECKLVVAENTKGPGELRAEADHWRGLERFVTDPAVLGEIRRMIAELEQRAKELEAAEEQEKEG